MTGTSTLQADIWAQIRIPVRRNINAVADAYCDEHKINAADIRGLKGSRPTKAMTIVRDGMISTLHEAGFGPLAISNWFRHYDSSSIRRRMYDMGLIGNV